MHIGKRILYLRKINGLTQEQLSQGIISTSHLSNIECGRFEPHSDILPLLGTKLKVELDYLLKTKEVNEDLSDYLTKLEELLDDSNYKQAMIYYEEIIAHFRYIYNIDQEFHFTLLEELYFIKTGNLHRASIAADKLGILFDENTFSSLSPKLKNLFFYVNALFNYYQKHYTKSHDYYLKQVSLVNEDLEKAKIYFNISLVLLKLNDPLNALSYANSSLELYLLSHELEKAIDVYIFLSVLYWENNKILLAEQTINKAKNLSQNYKLEKNLDKIYHNLGLIHQSKNEHEVALDCFQKSLDLKISNGRGNAILTFRSVIEIYIKVGNLQSAKETINKAHLLCNNQLDHCHINLLSAKINYIEGDYSKYEKVMEKSIDFLLEMKEINHLVSLVEELGSYYYAQKKYKKAASYFKVGLLAQKGKGGI